MATITYREALNQALAEEMERDPSVFLMGEEVGHYQGAYKVSQGLLEKFGADRVKDTPIAEGGFTGVGIGAAMVGMRPIIEVMTWNFSLVCIDQIINNAAKIRYMSGGQFKIPLVIRGPGGAGGRLAAQHSQSFESYYAYVPGLKVVMPSVPYDAKGLLKSAVREDNPVIFIEAEKLYNTRGDVPEGEYTIPIGVADVKREGADVTLVAWSRMLLVALKAAEDLAKEGISAEVVDPRTLRPFDEERVFESVRKTNRCVVVEEGWRYCGFGAEVSDRIQRGCFDDLDAPVERVTGEDVPMPYAGNLELAAIPDAPRVIAAAKRVLYR
jgi:pyruvate dehydrogenase E1 component beta subunit